MEQAWQSCGECLNDGQLEDNHKDSWTGGIGGVEVTGAVTCTQVSCRRKLRKTVPLIHSCFCCCFKSVLLSDLYHVVLPLTTSKNGSPYSTLLFGNQFLHMSLFQGCVIIDYN